MSTRTALEAVLARYLLTTALDGVLLTSLTGTFKGVGDVVPLRIHAMPGEISEEGELPEEWSALQLPAVVVSCNDGEQVSDFRQCRVSIASLTSKDENDAPNKVHARLTWLEDFFHEDNLDDIRDALNALTADVTIIGISRDGDGFTFNGQHVIETLKLMIHASPGTVPP